MSLQKDHVTIYDVARAANVSVATVSRVLTGKSNVREETKKKVLKVVKEYNYEPNLIARALHNRVSKTIGIIVQSLTNKFFVKICNEAEIYANTIGYTLLFGITSNVFENETKLINMFEKRQVDGFIFLGGRINEVSPENYLINELIQIAGRLPIVFVNGKINHENCFIVRTDEKKEFKKIIDYVIKCNHKKIGLITGQRGLWPTEEKINVFKKTLNENNIKINEKWIISGEYIVESGIESMKKILSLKERPSAVLCTNDILAIGAINEVNNHNLKVPDDISVTGFDDIDISKFFIPGITTIKQNYKKLAEYSINKILDYINNNNSTCETVVEAELIIRKSCKKL